MHRLINLQGKNEGDDAFYKRHYGPNVIVTHMGKINLVHLDNPSPETIRKRIDEVAREEICGDAWDDDCPLCRMFKNHPHDVVYLGDFDDPSNEDNKDAD